MSKPKVGDKFFLVKTGYNRGMIGDNYSAVVSKVGIKYFTIEAYPEDHPEPTEQRRIFETQFSIDTKRQKTQMSVDCYLFDSKQEYDDMIETLGWRQKFNKSFDHWKQRDYTLEQYREAAKIFGITLKGGDNA